MRGDQEKSTNYYDKGSVEPAKATTVTMRSLERRRKLTENHERLVLVLVGLPARGKSFIGRKLQAFLSWKGIPCKVFNVGMYRREAHAALKNEQVSGDREGRDKIGSCDANFFDSKNEAAAKLREEVARIALQDMLKWLDEPDDEGSDDKTLERRSSSASSSSTLANSYERRSRERVAIFDATNSTIARRQWILQECTSPEKRVGKPTGVIFVESICNDKELLEENFRFKVANSPDFNGMSTEDALEDIRSRVKKYEDQYETIDDDSLSYIKVFNLSSKLMANQIYGRMSKAVIPALMAWNVGIRPIYICRPGKTVDNLGISEHGDWIVNVDETNGKFRRQPRKGEHLGGKGRAFREALCKYMEEESMDFMAKRTSALFSPSFNTGTSINGLRKTFVPNPILPDPHTYNDLNLPFPCKIMSSTMPRAVQTCMWEEKSFPVDVLSNLNPLDKGDFCGMELEQTREMDPEWYAELEKDPYNTRFPGGECYRDLVSRLVSCVIDMEQQVSPVLVVSHVSVIQVLLAYFRNSPIEQCTSIEVPLHTVIKITPVRGGGWKETRHPLLPDDSSSDEISDEGSDNNSETRATTTPIWGDHAL